jgi:hypothetical protein
MELAVAFQNALRGHSDIASTMVYLKGVRNSGLTASADRPSHPI